MKAPTDSLVSLPLLTFAFLAACGNLAAPVDPMNAAGSHTGGQAAAHAGSSGSANSSGGSADHAGTSSGGSSDHAGGSGKSGAANANGGTGGNAGNAGSTADAGLSLTSADAQVIGRFGDSVRFTVAGTRPTSGVYSIAVSFEDAQGAPVNEFDSDFDGKLDSPAGHLVLDAPLTSDTFTATATLTGVADAATLAKAKVQLVDGTEQLSETIEATIGAQKLLMEGDACDTKDVTNRCDMGQSCSGSPSKCTAGVAPTLVEVKYLHSADPANMVEPTVLIRGTDPDDDMGSFHIEYLDANSMPVLLDGTDDHLDTTATRLSSGGSFFFSMQPAYAAETSVAKIRVTALDSIAHTSQPMTVGISSLAQGASGASCDPRGFSGCVSGYLCVPGTTPTAGKCTKASSAQATACAASPKLDPAKGLSTFSGRITGPNLWLFPAGCTRPENAARPQATVALHLASAAQTLTVSTLRPETHTDTVLSMVKGCGDTIDLDWCHDDNDQGTTPGVLTLSNVAAGDYTVIIEFGQYGDGEFGLSVDAQ